MGAKVRVWKDSLWVFTHHERTRRVEKVGPVTRKNRSRAERLAEKINSQIALGQFEIDRRPRESFPCGEVLRDWHRTYAPTMKRSYERSHARSRSRTTWSRSSATATSRDLREADLLGFAREKLDAGLSPNTIRNALAVLRRVYYLAQREGRLIHNPALGSANSCAGSASARRRRTARPTRGPARKWPRSSLSLEEDAPKDGGQERRDLPAALLPVRDGAARARRSALRWEDVNLDARTVTIRRSLSRGEIGTPKSGRRRTVALSPGLASLLADLLETRRRQPSPRWPEVPPWVFASREGTPLDEGNVTRTWDRVRRRAQALGVRPLRMHCARHTWATPGAPERQADQVGGRAARAQ